MAYERPAKLAGSIDRGNRTVAARLSVSTMRDFLDPFDVPMTAQVVDGEIVLLGPNGVAIALTPEAARLSGERLLEAAARAAKPSDTAT